MRTSVLALVCLALAVCVFTAPAATPVCAAAVSAPAVEPSGDSNSKVTPYVSLVTMTFPVDTIVIPFDSRQVELYDGFGFVHAMLRNGSVLYRIIAPPDPSIKTDASPGGSPYMGGPILVLPTDQSIANSVRGAFPSLVLHKVTDEFSSSAVFVMNTPTKILLVGGWGPGYGNTYKLLDNMKIPYKYLPDYFAFMVPGELDNGNYDLVIDDCPGMFGMHPIPGDPTLDNVTRALREFAAAGHEVIFTCCAFEVNDIFPEYLSVVRCDDYGISRNATMNSIADFPAQYSGPSTIRIDRIYTSVTVKLPNVTVMSQSPDSPESCYWYFGNKGGIVEYFTFHTGEQTNASSIRMAITLYGNKILHITPADTGIGRESTASPSQIAIKGEGNQQIGEQAKVCLSLKAIGAPITAQSSFKLNYELMPYIESVSGSFVDDYGTQRPPDYLATNPNGSTALYWNVASIPNGKYWNVSFNVTSTVAGQVYVNAGIRSNITFYDSQGQYRMMTMKALKITVLQDVPEALAPILTAGVGSALIATTTAIVRMRRRQKGYA